MNRLRAAVIGAGYLGRLHAQKYALLDQVELAAVVDVDAARAQEVAQPSGARAHTDYRPLLGALDLVSIVVPTEHHHAVAKDCLQAGVHILVEKPVTQTLEQAQELVALAQQRRRVFQVGHLERFNPAVAAAMERVKSPMFVESHRLAAFKPRGVDVSVVLDLMIHDIDIVLSMVDSPIAEIRATGIPVLTDEIDIGNARIEFANGCVAAITASRVSSKSMRKIRVFQHDAYISIDTLEHRLEVWSKHAPAPGQVYPGIASDEQSFGKADPLLAEIRAFVDAVRHGTPPLVSGHDGRRALEVALAVGRGMTRESGS